MYKTIIFDLDGTLLDTGIGVKNAVKITISQLGLPKQPSGIIERFVGPPMQESFVKYFGMSNNVALEYANLFRKNYKQYTLLQAEVYPGIMELLDTLKNMKKKLAVATNKSHENAYLLLNHYGIAEKCDYIKGSDLEGKLSKTDILQDCIEYLNVDSRSAVLIGDSSYDAEAARAIGLDFVAVTYGFGFKKEDDYSKSGYTHICNNVKELGKFFVDMS